MYVRTYERTQTIEFRIVERQNHPNMSKNCIVIKNRTSKNISNMVVLLLSDEINGMVKVGQNKNMILKK